MDGDRSNERPGCIYLEDTTDEDSDYLEKELNVVADENDDDPTQALDLTLSTRCRAPPNEKTVPTSSTNKTNLIVSCTIDAASGGSGCVSFPQKTPHHLHQPQLQSVQPRGLPSTVQHPLYLQRQDHLQRSLLHPIPQNFPTRAHQASFHLPQGALSSRAVGDTTAASAAAQQQCQKRIQLQSHHQPLQPKVPALRFLPPLHHSWLPMHAPSPLLVTQEQKPSSGWNIASRTQSSENDTEPNPAQLISLDEMRRFMETFKNAREALGLTQGQVVWELSKMYNVQITRRRLGDFEGFYNFFKKKYQEFKSLLERWLEEFHRIHFLALTRPESVVRDLETQATTATTSPQVLESALSQTPKLGDGDIAMLNCDSEIDGDLSNDRPDSKSAEEKADQHPHEDSNGRRQEMKVMSPQHLERKPHHQDLQSVQPSALPRGLFSTMQHQRLIRLPSERNAEQLFNFEELQQFVKTFRNIRRELGFRQNAVASQLGREINSTVITRFEKFDETFNEMCKLYPILKHFLVVKLNIEISSVNMSESTSRAGQTKATTYATNLQNLREVFLQNPKTGVEKSTMTTTSHTSNKDMMVSIKPHFQKLINPLPGSSMPYATSVTPPMTTPTVPVLPRLPVANSKELDILHNPSTTTGEGEEAISQASGAPATNSTAHKTVFE